MIDIHSHILPGIDDGSRDYHTSLDMAEIALNSGVDVIIATPHCNIPGTSGNYKNAELIENYEFLCEKLYRHNKNLRLLLGAEVYGTYDLAEKIERNMIPTLHDTEYMLIEFDFGSDANEVFSILRDVRSTGIKQIIAHPERYPFIQQEPGILREFLKRGYYLQLNKDSLFGRFGSAAQYIAHYALDRRMASFVGTDAHSVTKRSASLSRAADYLTETYSPQYANELLFENARRIIEGEKVPHPEI